MIAALRHHLGPFIVLLVLLALTATGASLPIGEWNIVVALGISAAKTGIVVYFFMELKKENALIRMAACVGLIWLMVMLLLALSDYVSRYPGSLVE